ncbi:MAG: hypothetical protein JRI68_31365 [Deltaproteobacteria bacterium]|nr:hypothetical protein [Deltaproteobacteria bacterium]
MPKVTQAFAIALIVLGAGGYIVTGAVSVTALIPAFFGLPVLAFGVLAARPNARRGLWMHLTVVVMFLGLIGTARAVPSLVTLLTGGTVERPAAVVAQVIMALLCLAYVLLSVRSFVVARRTATA